MAYPPSVATVAVTATYLPFSDGSATVPSGTVTFTPNATLLDAVDGRIVTPKPLVATLDVTGHIAVTLMNTSDPDLQPAGWAYTITERVGGNLRTYTAFITGTTLDLATVAPALSAPAFGYILATARGVPNGVAAVDAAGRIPGIVDPAAAQDVATKAYVDAGTAGFGAWTSVTPLGSTALGTPSLQSRTAPGGRTEFRGQINWTGAYVSGTAMFQLPVGQRPAVAAQLNIRWAGTGSASTLCNIDVNGNASVASSTPAAGSTLSLDGQWFSHA